MFASHYGSLKAFSGYVFEIYVRSRICMSLAMAYIYVYRTIRLLQGRLWTLKRGYRLLDISESFSYSYSRDRSFGSRSVASVEFLRVDMDVYSSYVSYCMCLSVSLWVLSIAREDFSRGSLRRRASYSYCISQAYVRSTSSLFMVVLGDLFYLLFVRAFCIQLLIVFWGLYLVYLVRVFRFR